MTSKWRSFSDELRLDRSRRFRGPVLPGQLSGGLPHNSSRQNMPMAPPRSIRNWSSIFLLQARTRISAVKHEDPHAGGIEDGLDFVVGDPHLFIRFFQVAQYLDKGVADDADGVEFDQRRVVQLFGPELGRSHHGQKLVDLAPDILCRGRVFFPKLPYLPEKLVVRFVLFRSHYVFALSCLPPNLFYRISIR